MARTEIEHDIIMQQIEGENLRTFYPFTRAENCLCDDGETVEEKLNNIRTKAFSLATSAWGLDSTSGLYIATISDTSVKSYDNASVNFNKSTYSIAEDAGIKPYADEIQGTGIRLYSDSIPNGTVSGKYSIDRGVNS